MATKLPCTPWEVDDGGVGEPQVFGADGEPIVLVVDERVGRQTDYRPRPGEDRRAIVDAVAALPDVLATLDEIASDCEALATIPGLADAEYRAWCAIARKARGAVLKAIPRKETA